MEHIAISVIVPIYNTKPYLAECIESILAQKINVPIEVLLIDDGSTDGCGEVCDKYAARDERVRVIHQENQGLSAARNAGIGAAKGGITGHDLDAAARQVIEDAGYGPYFGHSFARSSEAFVMAWKPPFSPMNGVSKRKFFSSNV